VKDTGELRNFVATAQCYGDTFQQFTVGLMQERNIECRWVKDATNLEEWATRSTATPAFLRRAAQQPQLGFFDIRAVAILPTSHNPTFAVCSRFCKIRHQSG